MRVQKFSHHGCRLRKAYMSFLLHNSWIAPAWKGRSHIPTQPYNNIMAVIETNNSTVHTHIRSFSRIHIIYLGYIKIYWLMSTHFGWLKRKPHAIKLKLFRFEIPGPISFTRMREPRYPSMYFRHFISNETYQTFWHFKSRNKRTQNEWKKF